MIFEAYFIYSAATTVLVSVIAYLIGKAEGHAEGIKKGSRAISNVNKTLDELLMNIADERKAEKDEYPLGAMGDPDPLIAGHGLDSKPVEEKPKAKKKKTPAEMKPKRKKGKK
jgi:hypothetical protein